MICLPEVPRYKIRTNHLRYQQENMDKYISDLQQKYNFHTGISDLFYQLKISGACETFKKDRIFLVGYILSKEDIPFEIFLPEGGVN